MRLFTTCVAVAGLAVCAGGAWGAVTTDHSRASWKDVGQPSEQSLVQFPECRAPGVAAAVAEALSDPRQNPADGTLLLPEEASKLGLGESTVAAQRAAWRDLSDAAKAYQLCLHAEQDSLISD